MPVDLCVGLPVASSPRTATQKNSADASHVIALVDLGVGIANRVTIADEPDEKPSADGHVIVLVESGGGGCQWWLIKDGTLPKSPVR